MKRTLPPFQGILVKEYAAKKCEKLDRYFDKDSSAKVTFSMERGRHIVEITVAHGGMLFRASEQTHDMYASIDGAADKLNRQIRRYRTKLEKRLRETAMEGLDAEAAQAEDEPAAYNVVRTKKFPVKAMGVDDAIAQMELLDHDFFLFRDEETDGICLIYRRNDGAYGLLQPE